MPPARPGAGASTLSPGEAAGLRGAEELFPPSPWPCSLARPALSTWAWEWGGGLSSPAALVEISPLPKNPWSRKRPY